MVEAPLVRGGSDPWFPSLHAGEPGSRPGSACARRRPERRREPGHARAGRIVPARVLRPLQVAAHRGRGEPQVRPLTPGSGIIPLAIEGAKGMEVPHEWQILAARAEVTGKIQWRGPLGAAALPRPPGARLCRPQRRPSAGEPPGWPMDLGAVSGKREDDRLLPPRSCRRSAGRGVGHGRHRSTSHISSSIEATDRGANSSRGRESKRPTFAATGGACPIRSRCAARGW